jgi:uncharacterized membrane protein YuzA (DUF378 family)
MENFDYYVKWAYLVAMALVLVGGVNWGLIGVFGVDAVRAVTGKWSWIIYTAVGLAALSLAFYRDTYLPFLGETVLPCSMMPEKTPEHADTEVTVNGLKPGAKVLFWATEPATDGLGRINDWRRAYLDFANAGVTTADAAGRAVLRIRRPQPYTVPFKGQLQEHVHWRVCGDGGILGPVQTTPVDVI